DLSSKMLNTFILTMRGTPFVYYGDELGMTNIRFDRIEDYRDMPTLNEYQRLKNTGGDLRQFIESLKFGCRDNGRTPMQWNDMTQAGFTSGTPWIKVHPNYTSVNVAAETGDSTSCLNYFRTLTKLRKDYPALVYGSYTLLDRNNQDVYAYLRELDGEKILVALNFTDHKADVKLGLTVGKAGRLAGNYAQPIDQKFDYMRLRPYEAVVWKLE
ncbi:MAG: alpha-glucosidase C-terminal domain-containing protein, partial [Bacteroidetes bacterium]|nr:alpha-glucosidase C-terminal domain-containing protein [Bacteroidota bacterium]